jgi:ribosomal protein S18 acetylase RimI-like enzyme
MTAREIAIRLVTKVNTSLLDRVHDDVFDHKVQPALLQAFLANPANLLVVAVVDEEVIGMASGIAYVHPDKPLHLFINEVGVAAHFHRQGVGRKLLAALLQRGKELGCHEAWVATEIDNNAARGLYTSAGGMEDDERAVVYTYSLVNNEEA